MAIADFKAVGVAAAPIPVVHHQSRYALLNASGGGRAQRAVQGALIREKRDQLHLASTYQVARLAGCSAFVARGIARRRRVMARMALEAKVLTCGVSCMDIAQTIDGFPKPDAKLRATETRWLGGGNASNTACALARMGTPTALITKVGDDALGDALVTGVQADGVHTDGVVRGSSCSSAFSTILVDSSTGTRTIVHSPMPQDFIGQEAAKMVESAGVISSTTQWLHLDGRHPDAALALAKSADANGGICISMDMERKRDGLDELLPYCDAIFCNANFPRIWTGEEDPAKGLAAILEQFPRAQFALSTRGEDGSLLLARDGLASRLSTGVAGWELPVACSRSKHGDFITVTCSRWPLGEGQTVVDTTGAGDNFIGGFLHAWTDGRSLEAALATGAWVATQKIQQLGARLGPDFDPKGLPRALRDP